MTYNKISIIGYLGRNPEIRYTPNGQAVCNFTIATTKKRGDQETTTWFRVTVWGKQAEVANQYLVKGRQVYLEGELRQEEYTDKEGNRRQSLEVTATTLQFLGKAGENGGGKSADEMDPSDIVNDRSDDDIPF